MRPRTQGVDGQAVVAVVLAVGPATVRPASLGLEGPVPVVRGLRVDPALPVAADIHGQVGRVVTVTRAVTLVVAPRDEVIHAAARRATGAGLRRAV